MCIKSRYPPLQHIASACKEKGAVTCLCGNQSWKRIDTCAVTSSRSPLPLHQLTIITRASAHYALSPDVSVAWISCACV